MSLRLLFARLSDIADYLTYQAKFAKVEGFLHDLEGYALLMLAAHGPGTGEVVEIGSYMGRSTVFLATGSKSAGREKVTAVDHFRGSPEHQPGGGYASKVLAAEGTTYNRFLANLERVGVQDHVTPLVASSESAVRQWDKAVRLLFIDGDHSYEASRKDFETWSRFVVPKGLVCFHDINQWPGVTQFYNELLKSSQEYREVANILSLRVIQKQ